MFGAIAYSKGVITYYFVGLGVTGRAGDIGFVFTGLGFRILGLLGLPKESNTPKPFSMNVPKVVRRMVPRQPKYP